VAALDIRQLLGLAVKEGASDVHVTVGAPPFFRVNGGLVPLRNMDEGGLTPCLPGDSIAAGEVKVLSMEEVELLVEQLTGADRMEQFRRTGECDFAYGVPGLGRFRVNCFRQRGSPAMAIRVLSAKIPSIEELGLPDAVAGLARRPSGLVIVTGPAGSGKSTTLAAMVDLINRERCCHVITLENPIEYLHSHHCSIVNQREIGDDSGDFAGALRAALREDPDVILVGEMPDVETAAITLTAAETGHLVLAAMHTPNAALTIERLVDLFPPHHEGRVRMQLSRVLQGIISQQLFPRTDKKGRVAAVEVLVSTPAVQNLVREGKTYQIPSLIQTGARHGMQSFAQSLKKLHSEGLITHEELILHVHDTELLR
jgi:twitching motility protein PilT